MPYGSDPIIAEPPTNVVSRPQTGKGYGFDPIEQTVEENAGSLIGRIGKNVWNEAVKILPTDEPERESWETTTYLAQQERIKKREQEGYGHASIKGLLKFWTIPEQKRLLKESKFYTEKDLNEEYEDIQQQLLKPSKQREEDLKQYRQYAPTGKSALEQKLLADIKPPEELSEYLVDVGVGLLSFIGRLTIAKQIAPTAPPIVHWEMVNLAEGGKPGAGAAMYGLLGTTGVAGQKIAGKIGGETILAKIERYVARNIPTSAAFGGMAAMAGGGPVEIATQALIPPILEVPRLARELRARPQIMKRRPIEERPIPQTERIVAELRKYEAGKPAPTMPEITPTKAVEAITPAEPVTTPTKAEGITVYHGTSTENAAKIQTEGFKAIRPPMPIPPNLVVGIEGVYLSQSKYGAQKFAKTFEKGKVVPAIVTLKNPYIIDSLTNKVIGELENKYVWSKVKYASPQQMSDLLKQGLQAEGYDGIIIKKWQQGGIYAAKEPQIIAFDAASVNITPAGPPVTAPKPPAAAKPTSKDIGSLVKITKGPLEGRTGKIKGVRGDGVTFEVFVYDKGSEGNGSSYPIKVSNLAKQFPAEAEGAVTARPGFAKKEAGVTAAAGAVGPPVAAVPPIEIAVDKLLTATRKAKKLSKTEVKEAIHKLRSKQAAKGAAIYKAEIAKETPPDIAAQRQKAGYKGAADVPTMAPLDLSKAEWDSIYNKIDFLYPADNPRVVFTRGDTVDAFKKLQNPEGAIIPQPAEFGLIEKVIGKKAALGLWESMRPKMPYKVWDFIRDVNLLYKVMKFGEDVQYFRQTSTISQRNPVIFSRGAKTAIQSLLPEETAKLGKYLPGKLKKFSDLKFGEQLAEAKEIELTNNPNHESAVRAGVNFLSDRPWASWAERAEQYPTDLPMRMAGLGKKLPAPFKQVLAPIRGFGRYIAAQNRSMVTSMNQAMQGLFDAETEIWNAQKLTPKQREKFENNYADGINAFVKILRAKTPTGRAFQKAANYFFTSPSITLSRFYQPWIAIAKPGARLWATTAILSNIAKLALISYVASLVENWWRTRYPDKEPPIQGETNTTSADWGKVRSGRTTFDIGGGDAQFYRTALRLMTGHYLNEAGQTREMPFWDTVSSWIESRETPLIQAGKETITGEYFGGEKVYEAPKTVTSLPGKIGWIGGKMAWKQLGPALAEDIYSAAKYSGLPQALIAAPAAFLSMGVLSYPESLATTSTKLKNLLAQQMFEQNFEDLNGNQQLWIREQYPEIQNIETALKMERGQKITEEISIRTEAQAHKAIMKQLEPVLQNEIKRLGLKTGVSRKMGEVVLNDQRFERYQELTAIILNEVAAVFESSDYKNRSDTDKLKYMSDTISQAKEYARIQLSEESRQ